MKFLHIVSLVGMLWLTGCATTGGAPGVVSNAPDDTPTSSRPAHTPIIPKGPLQPIKAANASSQEVASLSTPADLWGKASGVALPCPTCSMNWCKTASSGTPAAPTTCSA